MPEMITDDSLVVVTDDHAVVIDEIAPEAAARRIHNEQVLASLEKPLIELEQAFGKLATVKLEQEHLTVELAKAEAEEIAILKNESISEHAGVKAILEARALKDLRQSRLTAATERRTEQTELVLPPLECQYPSLNILNPHLFEAFV